MRHLIISREYPPASYAPGGIGSYVANIAQLLAEQGETVHIIAERWTGAPRAHEVACEGRLIVHRIGERDLPRAGEKSAPARLPRELSGLKESVLPTQWFSWHAAFLAERLIDAHNIDVIEAQEWEAPLYVFLLRRALGLSPDRGPPCIIHLHSPTELTRRFNGPLVRSPQFAALKRMEAYCIDAADALLCPSRYLAEQCRDLFALTPDRIRVIPLPVGFTQLLERSSNVWNNGSICYVGRLEPRKGIIEWVDAALRAARDDAQVHFDFVGSDAWSLRKYLLERVPKQLHARFRFHGSKLREELPQFLAQAKAAVVPSRWENFPNVCIEAMSSGLPVIATRYGGMVEMIEDGHTGWLAPDLGLAGMVDSLLVATRRCLAASAEERARMGAAAAEAIRAKCDNERTVAAQLAFRKEVAKRGVMRSSLLAAATAASAGMAQHAQLPPTQTGSGAGVLIRVTRPNDARAVIESLRLQTQKPRAVLIVASSRPNGEDIELPRDIAVRALHGQPAGIAAWNEGIAALKDEGCGFFLFLDAHDELEPECLESAAAIFARRPEIGIVSFWTEYGTQRPHLEVRPSPRLIEQLLENEVAPASAIRAGALGDAPLFPPGAPAGFEIWQAANGILARGWTAVTVPALLARRKLAPPEHFWPEATALRAIRADILRPILERLAPETAELVDRYVPIPQAVSELDSAEQRLPRLMRYMIVALLDPRRASSAIVRRSQELWRRMLPLSAQDGEKPR